MSVGRLLPKSLLAACALLGGLCSHAWAIYMTGYTDWQSLSVPEKGAYVAGAVDYLTGFGAPTEPSHFVFLSAVQHCIVDSKTRDSELVNDIDRLYGDYIELRREPPAILVYLNLLQRCQQTIEQYMTAAGQQPPSFTTFLHNLQKSR